MQIVNFQRQNMKLREKMYTSELPVTSHFSEFSDAGSVLYAAQHHMSQALTQMIISAKQRTTVIPCGKSQASGTCEL